MPLSAVPPGPLSEQEALEWAKPLPPEELHAGHLANVWRRNRSQVQRWLKKWYKQGLIQKPAVFRQPRQPGAPEEPQIELTEAGVREAEREHILAPDDPDPWSGPVSPPPPPPPPLFTAAPAAAPPPAPPPKDPELVAVYVSLERRVVAIVLTLVALVIACIALVINTHYWQSLGGTSGSSLLLGALGASVELIALVLPSAAVSIWPYNKAASVVVTFIFLVAFSISETAAFGFAGTYLGDYFALRESQVAERTVIETRVNGLRADRKAITEPRSVAELDQAIQGAQPSARSVWAQSKGCYSVTLPETLTICGPLLALRLARGQAERRDSLDTSIHENETTLAALPVLGSGDPAAELLAKILSFFGVTVTAAMIQQGVVVVLATFVSMGGILGAIAKMVWRSVRK